MEFDVLSIVQMIGGLALFIYGMTTMGKGLEHAAVHGRFGAAGVVPVDAAGRDGLQNVKINIQALFHDQFSFSSSSDDAFFVSRYRSWPHRRRTLAGICVYRGSVHCNSYRSTASCG